MLQPISWKFYWLAIGLASLLYYLFIIAVFFRKDIFNWASRGRRISSFPTFGNAINPDSIQKPSVPETIKSFISELESYCAAASQEKLSSDEILSGTRRLLAKHGKARLLPYREAITNLIDTECYQKCSIHLSEAELSRLWD